MNMIEATKICFTKYARFSGRARRAEYWWFGLFQISAVFGAMIIDVLNFSTRWGDYGPISSIFMLITTIPTLAVAARRLHDIDRSGWWQLLSLVPIIGLIVLIIWLATAGDKGENRFGPDPL